MPRLTFLKSWWFKLGAIVFVTALILRLLFLWAMMSQIDVTQLTTLDRDSQAYLNAAEQIRQHFDFKSYGVLMFGPVYPAVLALWQAVSWGHFVGLVVGRQIVVSSVVAVLMMWWIYQLSNNRRVAFVAAMLNAISLISITLANIFFAETFFMVLLVGGLSLFYYALRTQKKFFFVLAGVPLSLAPLTRSAGQYFFLVLFIIAIIFYWGRPTRLLLKGLLWPLVTIAIILATTVTWISHNNNVYGIRQLALAAPGGMAHLIRMVDVEKRHVSWEEAFVNFTRGVKTFEGKPTDSIDITLYRPYYPFESVTDTAALSYNRAFVGYTQQRMSELIRNDTWLTTRIYLHNLWINITTDWGKHYWYLPKWDQTLRSITSQMDKRGLNYRGILLSFIGVLMLLRRRQYKVVLILVVIYGYFAALTGFSVFQGTRIFYPGQVAWIALAAHPLVWLYEWLKRRRVGTTGIDKEPTTTAIP